MVYVPCAVYEVGSDVVAVIVPAQLSVAVGAETLAEHSPVTVGNEAAFATGAVLSFTVTVVLQELLAPFASVTVSITFVVPSG
jgi:hypothetical protein